MNNLYPRIEAGALSPARSSLRTLILLLVIIFMAMMAVRKARLTSDFMEYVLMTVSITSHGSADIRPDDIAQARALMPEYAGQLRLLEANMGDPAKTEPLPGFYRGLDGKIYAIHFPGYSVLAAVPFKLFTILGVPALKCYQAINLAAVFTLGMALLRLFGSVPRALTGLALYMLCGGVLYWNWSSPETVSAALLLAGLVFYCSGAPLRGGLFAGIAAFQNPSIVLTLGAMPVLAWALQPGVNLWQGVKLALRPRAMTGLVMGGMLAILPVLFNLSHFGKPSIIAEISTGAALISAGRLYSLYFDLNQGMILAIPAVALMLLAWGWRNMMSDMRRRHALALLICVLLTIGYAIPAMTVHNWNSGAQGVMRYAFWSAMPFVFLLLWRLRHVDDWPKPLLAAVLGVQSIAMGTAASYSIVQFSPIAKPLLKYGPAWYHPEPEIFAERTMGRENIDKTEVPVFRHKGTIKKALYHYTNAQPGANICGPGKILAGNGSVQRRHDWVYLDAPLRCTGYSTVLPRQFDVEAPGMPAVSAGNGWSALEDVPGHPVGMWSMGESSRLRISYEKPGMYTQVVIRGEYYDGNSQTHVTVNGEPVGWIDLQAGAPVVIPRSNATDRLDIELRHESPRSPGPQDGRTLALYLMTVTLLR